MASALQFPLYFLMLLVLLPISTSAQSYSNITTGSSLTASNDDSALSSWISASGDFAFGFKQIENKGFLLAIWFNKIHENTIVWSANRFDLAQKGSIVELTTDGLFLTYSTGEKKRIADPGDTAVAYAAMLDTGNFVLASRDSDNLWESFDQPTDTILPTQIMKQGSKLIASISEKNYSSGRFMLTLQPDGNLILYTITFPLDKAYKDYWSIQTSAGGGVQLIFNQSGLIYLIAKNGSILNQVSSTPASTQEFYQRAVVDYDGVFRHYIYLKSSASSAGNRPMAWSSLSNVPSDICTSVVVYGGGGGACGLNSYCTLVEDSRRTCRCPPGYTFFDPNDEMKGCKQNFDPQSCDKASEEMDLFEFREIFDTDWPGSDFEHFEGVSEDFCKEFCLNDCFCAAVIFKHGVCWKKAIPLVNGRFDQGRGNKALIKVRKDNYTSLSPGSRKQENTSLIYILSGLLSSSIFLHILSVLVIFILFYHLSQRKQKINQPQKDMLAVKLQSFTYKELAEVTGEFEEELGRGAFGTVYKGVLAIEDKKLVAVKKLNRATNEGEQEFEAEVKAIGRTNHRNLVQLLGFCNEGQHRLLVYEYMSNGSLADFLFGSSKPNWCKRVQIAFGTAGGLLYLHEECSNQIIHCDIKPQNILLDDSLTARISDFGLAKLLKVDQTHTTTAIRGTKGYVAPEWFKNLPITVKVDVYCFGILLLELVCCRRNFKEDVEEECQMVLAEWASDCFKEGTLDLLVENDEEAMEDTKMVEKFVMIAIWCIQEDPSLRPTMKNVVHMMEGALEVSTPPYSTSFIGSI